LTSLPDVNVLIALSWTNHPHHDAAHRWFAKDGHLGWATCLLTQSGFLRLSLNGHVVGVSIGCAAAVSLLQGLVGHAQHQFVELAPGLTAKPFDDLISRITGTGKLPMQRSCTWLAFMV
jgi:predicted nucleic acid-binding protein